MRQVPDEREPSEKIFTPPRRSQGSPCPVRTPCSMIWSSTATGMILLTRNGSSPRSCRSEKASQASMPSMSWMEVMP